MRFRWIRPHDRRPVDEKERLAAEEEWYNRLMPEEFPEGPYGAPPMGKGGVRPLPPPEPGEGAVGREQDEDPQG